MAANDYRTVSTGDRLSITAPVWNGLLGLLHPQGRPRANQTVKNLYARNPYVASLIKIRNSASALSQFGVLGIDTTTLVNPATNAATLLAWKQQPIVDGIAPTLAAHLGKFVVTIEAIPNTGYGLAVASGVVAVQLDVLDADHRYADVKNSDATMLQTRAMGAARILWKESGTGTKWGIVNIGVLPPAMFPVTLAKDGGSAGDLTTQCSWTYTVTDLQGYQIGTTMTPLKLRPSVGKLVQPADGSHGVAFYAADGTFKLWDANEVPDVGSC